MHVDRNEEKENEETLLAARQFCLEVVEKSLLQKSASYSDSRPCLPFRKKTLLLWAYMRHSCFLTQKSRLFDNLVLTVIFNNCIHQV